MLLKRELSRDLKSANPALHSTKNLKNPEIDDTFKEIERAPESLSQRPHKCLLRCCPPIQSEYFGARATGPCD
jgi:hypothetical protein